ncbi:MULTISPECIES: Six-bladed beta-propeller, TolB-like protein [unclassified Exiguobacterium]|uniref:Six-bladed beta-propeller, TolB-like protein n=1 Tax=Exiguobacterium sp. R-39 TaxID=3416708 RepID=UPI00103F0ED0
MEILDARALPADHSDILHVTPSSVYFRRRLNSSQFHISRFDLEDQEQSDLTPDVLQDHGPTRPFVKKGKVYCLNEQDREDGGETQLLSIDLHSGKSEHLATWRLGGDLTLYWVLNERYMVLLHVDGTTTAFLYDVETTREHPIKDERLYGITENYRELYFFLVTLADIDHIVCNARLDEFSFYDALESGVISPEDPIDHSESLLIAPLSTIVAEIEQGVEHLSFRTLLRLDGEGDTVQYLGEQDGHLVFSAYTERLNEEVFYEIKEPSAITERERIRWSDFEPLDFTYDDVESTIFIVNDRSNNHHEVMNLRTGARYLDRDPFERVLRDRFYLHESIGTDAEPMVTVYDGEQAVRHRFEDAYYMIVSGELVILSVNQLK